MEDITGKAKGGKARAEKLTPERRASIAKMGAIARWGDRPVEAIRRGNFKEEFGINVDCYVLDDDQKTAVISQRGMAKALGMSRGSHLISFLSSNVMSDFGGREIREKMEKPLIFQWGSGGREQPPASVHGHDVAMLIDICNAISSAHSASRLTGSRYEELAKQARIILGASAKSGIRNLVYALAGYSPTVQEVIDAFRAYVLEEAKKYEKEFPTELYAEWQRLYSITPPERGKNWKEMHLTIIHIYEPLAASNGKLLKLLRNAKKAGGDRNKKLFQFLNEVGTRALRMHLGRVLEMAQSSSNKNIYEEKIATRFGIPSQLKLPIEVA